MKREGGQLVVTAELAGIDPKDVEVTLDNGTLTLEGEKTEDKEISEEDRYIHERSYGKFQRRANRSSPRWPEASASTRGLSLK
jgi:HSP20 family molecular chaperone IbpA